MAAERDPLHCQSGNTAGSRPRVFATKAASSAARSGVFVPMPMPYRQVQPVAFRKPAKISHRLRRHGVILRFGLAFDDASLRVLRFWRIGRRLPPGKLAGIAAQAQHAPRRQIFELADQSGIALREETRIDQLLHLIRQADEVGRHMRPCGFGWNLQGDLRSRPAQRTKAGCGKRKRCGGKEPASADCNHLLEV